MEEEQHVWHAYIWQFRIFLDLLCHDSGAPCTGSNKGARLPKGNGPWPAIWMLGSNIGTTGWPACGEIDIMEHHGFEMNKIFGTLHYPGRSGGNPDGNTKMISDASTAFHKYSLEWSASAIRILVDDQLCHFVKNSSDLPFNHNFFLILNLAIGGTFGGVVDPQLAGATMEVDYIRVYQ